MDERGFTLLELMIALLVLAILAGAAVHAHRDTLPRHRVSVAAFQVAAFLRQARAEAVTHGPLLLCDGNSRCDHFTVTDSLILADETSKEVRQRLRLPDNTTLSWRRFRGTALRYGRRGNLYYQNGHFLLCNEGRARKVVMNVIGTVRVENANGAGCP